MFFPEVLTVEECSSLVEETEARGFSPALVNVGGGNQVLATEVRGAGAREVESYEVLVLVSVNEV